ncbi:hypothetical protein [Deinococcus cellulosilyticus]|uniref:Lipopolysaccharide assembly protein A domain-containing protein n=1 Tax=Deinococcus cellulosilyticus (strain DSM 18568 / NBRC 106333 / KACC 11606 / 5516J-15) TaxID=1223518 RepID=A0A511MYS8_DEIC1|nr:hypothetical protein [Deinococcus cellulosilyticus]GEM45754.1 hypothetical protein DC3_13890 [Deinococcus cellulosilyticus NBRC 106333 = KACC 11606]
MNRANGPLIAGLVIVLLIVIFFLQNMLGYNATARISFLFLYGYIKTGWLILWCLLGGGLAGFLLAQAMRRR